MQALFSKPGLHRSQFFKDLTVDVETAFVGKPIPVGGFDMENQKPKAMQKAIPAGSIYVLSSDNEKTPKRLV
ncbi:MAG: hypothetical protein HC880_04620 [Bacteroidia bacterium]|nr:hypothetical protein [Bacteroidia bacterium]